MRAIDADALTEDCKRYLGTLNPDKDGKECTRIHWLIGVLENAPTIDPEPCEDAVSRQDVIDAARKVHDIFEGEYDTRTPYGVILDVQDAVIELPPVTPKRKWIPCSERLPEVGTYVLISKKALNFRSNLPSVCTAHRSCDPRSGKEEWNDMLLGELDDYDVLAWMPLPEPYAEKMSGGGGRNDSISK